MIGVNVRLMNELKAFCMHNNPRFNSRGSSNTDSEVFTGLRFENINNRMEGMTLIHGVTLAYAVQIITNRVFWIGPETVYYVKPDMPRIRGLTFRVSGDGEDHPYLHPRNSAAILYDTDDGLVYGHHWEYGFRPDALFPDDILSYDSTPPRDIQMHPATLALAGSPMVMEGLGREDNASVYFRYSNDRGYIISRTGYFILTFPLAQDESISVPEIMGG